MLDLDLLRTFVAIVDSGGFTRAAGRVHRTQSTVSQQIRRLEDDLGRKLLDRDRAGDASLTDEGEVLLGYARRLLYMAAEARHAILHPRVAPLVRLGVPEDFAGRKLTDLLSGFARRYPDFRLDTTSAWSSELRRLLDEGDIDVALVKRDVGDGRCLARWPERLAWVAGREADLTTNPLPLALFPKGCVYRERVIDALENAGRPWRIAYTSQGLIGVQAAVASGLGVSVLAADGVLVDHRRLGPEDGFPEPPPTELALVARAGRREPAVGRLVDYLVEHLGVAGNGA